jgi:hypothetical protein
MIDTKTFKHQIGERSYYFTCDSNSPIVEIKDALCHFIATVVNFENSVVAEMKAKQLAEEKKDESSS